ncbi:MAG: 5-carboxymethyl-2-hydroxymuconate isomerase [Rhizobiaceae bacterium]
MPHFIIEHSKVLESQDDIQKALNVVLEVGASSGVMNREDIKVRLHPFEHILHGDGTTSFIHVTVRLLYGRTDEQKEALAVSLRDGLDGAFLKVQCISIDVQDMNPAAYKKRLLN